MQRIGKRSVRFVAPPRGAKPKDDNARATYPKYRSNVVTSCGHKKRKRKNTKTTEETAQTKPKKKQKNHRRGIRV